MRILAIESSGTSGSVATCEGDRLCAAHDLDPQLRSARTLAPALRQILRDIGWSPAQVELVAVGIGPGSFTGLRLGVMTAKAFAFAAGASILGVGTLDVIASQVAAGTSGTATDVAAAIDAGRGEVYCGAFRCEGDDIVPTKPIAILSAERWLASLTAGTLVAGPALATLAAQLPAGVRAAPHATWVPSAAAVARLAAVRAASGARDDVFQLAPLYLRRSAAEEKADAQGA